MRTLLLSILIVIAGFANTAETNIQRDAIVARYARFEDNIATAQAKNDKTGVQIFTQNAESYKKLHNITPDEVKGYRVRTNVPETKTVEVDKPLAPIGDPADREKALVSYIFKRVDLTMAKTRLEEMLKFAPDKEGDNASNATGYGEKIGLREKIVTYTKELRVLALEWGINDSEIQTRYERCLDKRIARENSDIADNVRRLRNSEAEAAGRAKLRADGIDDKKPDPNKPFVKRSYE